MKLTEYPPHDTLSYKHIGNQDVYFDIFPPRTWNGDRSGVIMKVPTIVYFHAGGLTVGDRKSWFPYWLYNRVIDSGMAFITVDYQLLPPATGHDVAADIKDLFAFIRTSDRMFKLTASDGHNSVGYCVDPDAIGVSGSSAGGLCTYLAATVVEPKPRAILSLYGMGGDFMIPYYLEVKSEVFVRGREILDPNNFKEFLYPSSISLPVTIGSKAEYYPSNHPTPGLPANPRMYLARLYSQIGEYLDYYTGAHTDSLSKTLRDKRREVLTSNGISEEETLICESTEISPEEWARLVIPERHRYLFPQLSITSNWPAVFLIHGNDDVLVHFHESKHLCKVLENAGAWVKLVEIDGKGHSFDYAENAEKEFGSLFDEAAGFLKERLVSDILAREA